MNRDEIISKIKEKEIEMNNIKNELDKLKKCLIIQIRKQIVHLYHEKKK